MEEMTFNPFELFAGVQESYQEALQKSAEENKSFAKIPYFRMNKPGTYPVRILPLAPVMKPDGTWNIDRKGYEYPTKSNILGIVAEAKGGKERIIYVPIVHSGYAGISVDLIDTYIDTVKKMYGDDEQLIKKVTGNGIEGGLKWNHQRVVYIYDLDNPKEGIQMLTLSYSQYKDLETAKVNLWKKLLDKDENATCPISSIKGAYPVEIIRKQEGKKVSYSFNIDVVSGTKPLSEEELQALLNTPRLPEMLYRYTRYQLEATIVFLEQYDNEHDLDVMKSQEIADAIEKIKMELPTDDKSHFSIDKKGGDADNTSNGKDLNSLRGRMKELEAKGVSDKSEEGQTLRDDICEFIDENDLDVRVSRSKTNRDLIEDIEDALEREKSQSDAPTDDGDETDDRDNGKDDDDERPARGEHNDDTNEPAVTTKSRRPARNERR